MPITFESVIFYLILLDSLFANITAWAFPKWYAKKFKGITTYLPLTKPWTAIYLVLVLWLGFALYRLNLI